MKTSRWWSLAKMVALGAVAICLAIGLTGRAEPASGWSSFRPGDTHGTLADLVSNWLAEHRWTFQDSVIDPGDWGEVVDGASTEVDPETTYHRIALKQQEFWDYYPDKKKDWCAEFWDERGDAACEDMWEACYIEPPWWNPWATTCEEELAAHPECDCYDESLGAEERAVHWTVRAKEEYEKYTEAAWWNPLRARYLRNAREYAGYAIHYAQDAVNPPHADPWLEGLGNPHTYFESCMDFNFFSFAHLYRDEINLDATITFSATDLEQGRLSDKIRELAEETDAEWPDVANWPEYNPFAGYPPCLEVTPSDVLPEHRTGIVNASSRAALLTKSILIYVFDLAPQPIERGLEYLRERHSLYPNGSWSNNVGITGLGALAFLNYGHDESDPDVGSAIGYLLSKTHGDGSIYDDYWQRTYQTSMAILALKATHNPAYEPHIEQAKNWLVNSQWDESCLWGSVSESSWYWGGFGYGYHVRPDMSNTQWAALALHAAGLPQSDPAWEKMRKFASRSQNRTASNDGYSSGNDGGFMYYPGTSLAGWQKSYGSMTGAGLWTLMLSGLEPTEPRVKAGLDWVEDNYTWDTNPGMGSGGLYYYYVSMSKALTMARKTKIGGWLGIGAHDWFEELREKLADLQKPDGSWVNSNTWAWEGNPELVTAYALLSLETRTLAPGQSLSMSIILHSPADLHLYDAQGRHTGIDYDTGEIELEIPGSTHSPEDPQTITVTPPLAGNYSVQLVGTTGGDYEIEIVGTQNDEVVSHEIHAGTIEAGEAQGTFLNVTAMEGALTIFSSAPVPLPVMAVEPSSLTLTGLPGMTLEASFAVEETGGSQTIEGVTVFASDLLGPGGSVIPGASVSLNPTSFDVAAGGSQLVDVQIPLPPEMPPGTYAGTITAESLNAGARSVSLTVEAGNLPPEFTVPGEQHVQYSDWLAFGVSASDPDDPPESLRFSAVGLCDGLTLLDNLDGTASVKGTVQSAAGTCLAEITVTDPDGLTDADTVPIVVAREDALLAYSGDALVTAGSPVTLTAAVIEAADGSPGDITRAAVFFDVTAGIGGGTTSYGPAAVSVSGQAFWALPTGLPPNVYSVDVRMDPANGYYQAEPADTAALVVYDPSAGFTTGGGWVTDGGGKGNFGFSVKYLKKGNNIKGQGLYVYRDGDIVTRVKSNAMFWLVINGKTAVFSGKATVNDVGNHTFEITVVDNGEPGATDTFAIKIWRPDGTLLHELPATVLGGGNLMVPQPKRR